MISQAAILIELIFRGFRKISKSDYWHRHIGLCDRFCVRMEHLGWHWRDFHEIWYLNIFRKFPEKLHVWLRSGNNNAYFTWQRLYICDNVPLNSSYDEKGFQTEVVQKIKTHIYIYIYIKHRYRSTLHLDINVHVHQLRHLIISPREH